MRRWTISAVAAGLVSASALSGCVTSLGEDLDPARTLADEEWWDEGPPAGDADESAMDGDLGSTSDALTGAPRFELPFPCGQVWAGQTRTGHSPQLAIDFNRANDIGDAVLAASGGVVTRVGNEGSVSYGRWIELDHGNGYRTRYAHLSAQSVSVGQRVAQGQRIGAVGDTGGSSGPHLHYEVRRYGTPVRPSFAGVTALFYGTRNYTSQNACGEAPSSPGGATAVIGRVNTSGADLTVRSGPGTGFRAVGGVADGAQVRITCQVRGQSVTGTYGTSSLWDFVGTGYVSDAFVSTGSDGPIAPTCR